jgi:hypothetical protein
VTSYNSIVLTYVVVDRSLFTGFDERSVLSESSLIRRLELAAFKGIPGGAYVTFVFTTAHGHSCVSSVGRFVQRP